MGLQDLPCDLLLRAMGPLDHFTLISFGMTCRSLRILARDRVLWMCIFGRTVPCRTCLNSSIDWFVLFKTLYVYWHGLPQEKSSLLGAAQDVLDNRDSDPLDSGPDPELEEFWSEQVNGRIRSFLFGFRETS